MNRFPNPSVAAVDVRPTARSDSGHRGRRRRRRQGRAAAAAGTAGTAEEKEEREGSGSAWSASDSEEEMMSSGADSETEGADGGQGERDRASRRRGNAADRPDAHLQGRCVTLSTLVSGHRRYVRLDSAPALVDSPEYYRVSQYRDHGHAASYTLSTERATGTPQRVVTNPLALSPDGALRTGPTMLASDRTDADRRASPSSLAFFQVRRSELAVAPEVRDARWPLKPTSDRHTFYVEVVPPPRPAHETPRHKIIGDDGDDGDDARLPATEARPSAAGRHPESTTSAAPRRARADYGARRASRTTSTERHVLRKWRAIGKPDPDSVWVVTNTQQATYALALVIGVLLCAALWHYPRRTVCHHVTQPAPPPPPPSLPTPSGSLR